jgi:hypothetical protein
MTGPVPACRCWQLPTRTGTAPLAVLAQSRRLRLTLNDGRRLEGELDWAYWRRGTDVDRVLELSDQQEVTLLDVHEVSTVEVISPPLRPVHLLALVTESIENWRGLLLGEQQYWDVLVGDHQLLEVSIKRSRLTCQPVGEE